MKSNETDQLSKSNIDKVLIQNNFQDSSSSPKPGSDSFMKCGKNIKTK